MTLPACAREGSEALPPRTLAASSPQRTAEWGCAWVFPHRLGVELLRPVRHLLPSTVLGMAGAQKCLLNYPKGPPRYACDALQSRVTEAHLTAWGTLGCLGIGPYL